LGQHVGALFTGLAAVTTILRQKLPQVGRL